MPFNEKIINERNGNIAALVEIMRALRDREKGCPWDIEQTFESISQYTIEEAYEVLFTLSSPKTCGCRDTILSETSLTTSLKLKYSFSEAIWE